MVIGSNAIARKTDKAKRKYGTSLARLKNYKTYYAFLFPYRLNP